MYRVYLCVVRHIMRLLTISFLFFGFSSCRNTHKPNVQSVTYTKGDHLIDAFGKVGFDTSTFKKLDCGLYMNNLGVLAYKAIDNSLKFDSTRPLDVYLTTVYNQDSDSPGDDMKEIRFVVDTTTFAMLPNGHFEDKNHHYQFTPMSDGGTITSSKKRKP